MWLCGWMRVQSEIVVFKMNKHKLITLAWRHFQRNAVSTGILLNLGTFMLRQPWCYFPNSRPKSFFVFNINSGIIHEKIGFCEASKLDYVLGRTSSGCQTKCNAEPFPLLACASLVWWCCLLAVIQNDKIQIFCLLLPAWSHGNTRIRPLFPNCIRPGQFCAVNPKVIARNVHSPVSKGVMLGLLKILEEMEVFSQC